MKTSLLASLIIAIAFSASRVPARDIDTHIPAGKPTVLNNYVTELVHSESIPLAGMKTIQFTNPRKGWIFVRCTVRIEQAGTVSLELTAVDRKASPIGLCDKNGPCEETVEYMRFVPAGTYTLQTEGRAGQVEDVTVRTIPVISYAMFDSGPRFKPFGRYDKAYLQHIGMWDVCNEFVTYSPEGHFMAELVADNKHIVVCTGVPNLTSAEPPTEQGAYDYWTQTKAFKNPQVNGIIADEFLSRTYTERLPIWAAAVKRLLRDHTSKTFLAYLGPENHYTYLDDAPRLRPFVEAVQDSTCIFAFERYLQEQRTEAEAWKCIKDALKVETLAFEKYAPGFAKRCVYVMGFLCAPPATLNVLPSVDYKVYLDMQFNFMATEPTLAGMYGVQHYNSSYCDEDYMRWGAKLFRHYCIEGRTDRLSSDPYVLAHIGNPDFEDGLGGWEVSDPSFEPDSPNVSDVRTGFARHLGYTQGRYVDPMGIVGDSYAILRRSGEVEPAISQAIQGLTPGRYYSIKATCCDISNTATPPKDVLTINILGGELLEDCSIHGDYRTHPSRRVVKSGKDDSFFHFYRYVFKAKTRAARLTISCHGPVGNEYAINGIEVEPYLKP